MDRSQALAAFRALLRPVTFAQNEFERDLANLCERQIRNLFKSVPVAAYKFTLRAYWIPCVCRSLVPDLYPRYGLGLGIPNCYHLAFQRTTLELLHLHRSLRGIPTTTINPVLEWYLQAPEGLAFWMKRFDNWLTYTKLSFSHFLTKQSYDLIYSPLNLSNSVLLGIIARSNLSKLKEFLPRLGQDSPESARLFEKQLKTSPRRWKHSFIDTWLIETWPIIDQYRWSFYDIQKVLSAIDIRQYNSKRLREYSKSNEIKERAKKLGLSRIASLRPGRPKEPDETSSANLIVNAPPMTALALGIHPIAENIHKWFNRNDLKAINR